MRVLEDLRGTSFHRCGVFSTSPIQTSQNFKEFCSLGGVSDAGSVGWGDSLPPPSLCFLAALRLDVPLLLDLSVLCFILVMFMSVTPVFPGTEESVLTDKRFGHS